MTIHTSGTPIKASEMNTEIGNSTSTNLDINTNKLRMLAGQASGSTGSVNWGSFYGKTYLDGSTSARAAPSAQYIKNLTGTTTNGVYWIKPGTSTTATQVYCDMNIDGGGYMMVACSHPSAGPSSGWGWQGGAVSTINTFSTAYQLGWYTLFHPYGATFSDFIFGNRANINNYNWGPFVYKHGGISYTTFMTSDTQQSSSTYTTLQSNTSIYGTTSAPGMQGAIGYPVTGTSNNLYYMRDCCGFSTYGAFPTYMQTTYCSNSSVQFYCGPWCNGSSTDGSGNFVQGGSSSYSNTGGTNQYMIMVR
jgi:hypothetical protein